MRLTKDVILFTTNEMPKWNPMNVCSYHLQEAGATPVQELAFALATAIAILDTVKDSGEVAPDSFGEVVGRISFFVNAGLRFITELCKMRAFAELWDEITARALRRDRRQAAPVPLRRAGELAGSHRAAGGEQRLSHPARDAGCHALERRARARRATAGVERGARPAAPVRPAMVAAHAADPRLRDRPARLRRHLRRLHRDRRQGRGIEARGEGRARAHRGDGRGRRGGRVELHEVQAGREQLRAAGVDRARRANRRRRQQFIETETSPLSTGEGSILTVPHEVEAEQIERLKAWRAERDGKAVATALEGVARRREGRPQRDAALDRGREGRRHHRRMGRGAARSVRRIPRTHRRGRAARQDSGGLDDVRSDVERVSQKLGRRIKFLVGKPGLDGHSNGAEQIAVRARDAGMEVVYEGIRLTPAEIVNAALEEGGMSSACRSCRDRMCRW